MGRTGHATGSMQSCAWAGCREGARVAMRKSRRSTAGRQGISASPLARTGRNRVQTNYLPASAAGAAAFLVDLWWLWLVCFFVVLFFGAMLESSAGAAAGAASGAAAAGAAGAGAGVWAKTGAAARVAIRAAVIRGSFIGSPREINKGGLGLALPREAIRGERRQRHPLWT
jgi:hypothetical protein